jgi:hypothetical protein
MKNKSMIYVLFAIAIGYFLISSLPGKFAIIVDQKTILSESDKRSEEQMLETPPQNKSTIDSGEPLNSNETLATEDAESIYTDNSNISNLTFWWAIDLLIAIAVYWVAKNRF